MNVKKKISPYETIGFDSLRIQSLEVSCRVGCTKEERAFPQLLSMTMTLYFPLRKAGITDNLENTVDYALVAEEIKKRLSHGEFQLIETVAEISAQQILKNKLIRAVQIEVTKKILPGIEATATIWREK